MPRQIILNDQIQEDTWNYLDAGSTDISSLPGGDIVVALTFWQENKDALVSRNSNIGIYLDSDDEPEDLADDLENISLVAVNFPAFTDGRGYSCARILRDRYKYQGDIRAVGDVLHDQLFYMGRCGFSSFAVKEGKDIEEALNGLKTISYSYQAASDNPNPLFRQR